MADEATFSEVKRLLDAGRDRDANAFLQRQGLDGLMAWLREQHQAQPADALRLDMLCRELWRQNEMARIRDLIAAETVAPAVKCGWEVLLEAKKEHSEAFGAALGRLVRLEASVDDAPAFIERELASLKALRRLDSALEAAVADDSISMSFAALHTRRLCLRKQWDVSRQFEAWIARAGDAAARPMAAFLEVVGDLHEAAAVLPAVMTKHGDWMKQHTEPFGKAGYAYASSGLYAETAAWLEGCETRDDLQGWIAANHITALWALHRYEAAGKVAAEVLRRDLRDATWDWNAAAAAFGHALAGRAAETQAALEAMTGSSSSKNAEFEWAAELARSVLRALKLARSESKRVLNEERQRLDMVLKKHSMKLDHASSSERYELALKAIGQHGGFRVGRWRLRSTIRRPSNPLRSWWVIVGLVLVLLAVLRGCLTPGEEGVIDYIEEQNKSEQLPMDAAPTSQEEIDKLLQKPQQLKGR
jgi:hypothetical protein